MKQIDNYEIIDSDEIKQKEKKKYTSNTKLQMVLLEAGVRNSQAILLDEMYKNKLAKEEFQKQLDMKDKQIEVLKSEKNKLELEKKDLEKELNEYKLQKDKN